MDKGATTLSFLHVQQVHTAGMHKRMNTHDHSIRKLHVHVPCLLVNKRYMYMYVLFQPTKKLVIIETMPTLQQQHHFSTLC